MPRHDFTPSEPRQDAGGKPFTPGFRAPLVVEALRRLRRKRDKDRDGGGVPVEPDRPLGLSGGAAAALDFDE